MLYGTLIAVKRFIIFYVQACVGERGAKVSMSIMVADHTSAIEIRAIIFRDPTVDAWIAQGLEFDICAQAKTLEGVHIAFERAIVATAAAAMELGQEPFHDLPRAPEKFFRIFEHAKVRTSLPEDGPEYVRRVPTPALRPNFRVVDQVAMH